MLNYCLLVIIIANNRTQGRQMLDDAHATQRSLTLDFFSHRSHLRLVPVLRTARWQ
jgi:hypothetical protein